MAANKMGEQTKDNIILAAKKEFLDKGFEKSRMEDIASQAGITKAMLYYHFDSKENLLREIVKEMVEQGKNMFTTTFSSFSALTFIRPELVQEKIFGLLIPYKDIIRLVMQEVLNGKLDLSIVLGILHDFLDKVIQEIEKKGARIKDRDNFKIKIFFFQSLPLIMFTLFQEDFCKNMTLDPKKTSEIFINKFINTMLQSVKGR